MQWMPSTRSTSFTKRYLMFWTWWNTSMAQHTHTHQTYTSKHIRIHICFWKILSSTSFNVFLLMLASHTGYRASYRLLQRIRAFAGGSGWMGREQHTWKFNKDNENLILSIVILNFIWRWRAGSAWCTFHIDVMQMHFQALILPSFHFGHNLQREN